MFLNDEFYTAKLGPSLLPDTTKLLLKYYADKKTILVYIAYPRIARTFALTKKEKMEKRIKTVQDLAGKKARVVEKTGKVITLEPMKAYERKIIHSVLQDNPNVETRSIGQEPKRRIVITKK